MSCYKSIKLTQLRDYKKKLERYLIICISNNE